MKNPIPSAVLLLGLLGIVAGIAVLYQGYKLGPVLITGQQLQLSLPAKDEGDFLKIGATEEFAALVWKETTATFSQDATMPKVYFTSRSPKEFGWRDPNRLMGFYTRSERAIVIFPKMHVEELGADLSLNECRTNELICGFVKKDVRAFIGITLVHEFTHHLLHEVGINSNLQHARMANEARMFEAMKRVASPISRYGSALIDLEKKNLPQ